jgi:hypothetical protein
MPLTKIPHWYRMYSEASPLLDVFAMHSMTCTHWIDYGTSAQWAAVKHSAQLAETIGERSSSLMPLF